MKLQKEAKQGYDTSADSIVAAEHYNANKIP